jgi:hypothetical protein
VQARAVACLHVCPAASSGRTGRSGWAEDADARVAVGRDVDEAVDLLRAAGSLASRQFLGPELSRVDQDRCALPGVPSSGGVGICAAG